VAVFESKEDKLYSIMKEGGFFRKAIFVDMHADDVADRIVAALGDEAIQANSVFSPYEQCTTIVGDVGTKLGLTANQASCYETARSKHKTREACLKAGLGTPRVGTARTAEELEAVLEYVQFPAILKPSAGAASWGVYRANSLQEAKTHFATITGEVASNVGLGWNPGLEDSVVLVEELLIGPEFDTDILMWQGKPVYVRTVDNWDCLEPYFLETGSNMPSVFSDDMISELEQYSLDCVKACGFHFGCFHVECIITKEGPRLIEVNARQGGGSMQEFNMAMFDVDIFANFFISTFGIPINPPRAEPAHCAMADYSITCSKTGILRDIDFFETIRNYPGVVRATPHVKAGDKVTGLDSGFPVWLGEFLVQAPTPQQAKDLVHKVLEEVEALIAIDDLAPELEEMPDTTVSSTQLTKQERTKLLDGSSDENLRPTSAPETSSA